MRIFSIIFTGFTVIHGCYSFTTVSVTISIMSCPDDDWIPPSEAQLKVISARRERSDKISKLMGEYMLKGYKMLATTCTTCDTIELQVRIQR